MAIERLGFEVGDDGLELLRRGSQARELAPLMIFDSIHRGSGNRPIRDRELEEFRGR